MQASAYVAGKFRRFLEVRVNETAKGPETCDCRPSRTGGRITFLAHGKDVAEIVKL